MTNVELKEKIVALWNEYQADVPKEDNTVLYLSVTQDGDEKNDTFVAAVADHHFLRFVVVDFMVAVSKHDMEAVKGFLRDLIEKMVEEEEATK